MDREEAYAQSRKSPPGSRSLRCIWHCGRINEAIRNAARLGETSLELHFAPSHYVAQHRELFQELYLQQGFDVGFRPDYLYIRPTEWIMTLNWDREPAEKKNP